MLVLTKEQFCIPIGTEPSVCILRFYEGQKTLGEGIVLNYVCSDEKTSCIPVGTELSGVARTNN